MYYGIVARAGTVAATIGARAEPLRLGPLVLGAAVPFLFLHSFHQPSASVTAAGTDLRVYGADVAVAVVALTALATCLRRGFGPLRPGLPIWVAGAAFLAAIFAATAYGSLVDERYSTADHAATALKFAGYAALAPAVPLLVRTRRDLGPLVGGVVLWGVVATTFAVLQWHGKAEAFGGPLPHTREPSFLGVADFTAFSAAVLAVALATLALAPAGRAAVVVVAAAGAAGGLGLALGASLAPVGGLLLGGLPLLVLSLKHRVLTPARFVAASALVVVALGAALDARARDIDQFARAAEIGGAAPTTETTENVQTYAQRTILLYIGGRIFLDNPLFGIGWQGSAEPYAALPYVDDARRRFPNQPDFALPSAERPWGVQNAFLQALADLGLVGFVPFAALIAAGLTIAGRTALRDRTEPAAPLALAWILVAVGALSAYGLFAGAPLDALLWLALGLAAVSPVLARKHAR